jgi:amino acid adenylation domain-containing protein
MLLEAAFAVLVSRYSQERDIVLGSPIAGRVHRDVEPLIGFFVNTLVLRSDLSANPRFADLLESSKQTILDAYAHQHVPFEMLVEELQPERSLSHSPLFQVLFALQNAEQGEVRLGGLRLEPMGGASGIVKFDLELSAEELADGLVVHWSFKKELFDGTTIARMVSGFGELLAGLLARPEERVEELPLLTEEEREQVLVEWNDTTDLEDGAPFHCQFESWAALAPTAPALWFQGAEVTYGDLNRRANQLARFLTRWGIGRGAPVALCMERSVEVLVGLLAILKAGGVYVPLDPSYPDSRLAWMRADSQSTVLLSLKGQAGGLRADVRTLDLDAEWSEVAGEPGENMGCGVGGSDLAYIIYTSGSTGRPKGVAIPHRGLSNLAAAQREVFRLSPASRVLQFASLSFDASIFDFTMGLANGGCLCLAVREELLPGSGLVEVMCRSAVTHATLSPSVVAVLEPADLPELTTLAVAGEACPAELVARWAPGRRLLNCYGPTETTVWGTYQECRPGKGRPTIGRAILNAAAYVLDACLQPLPAGVSGELFLGGPGVGRGYVGRPELTAERFLPDPFSGEPGARLYRTGDLVRWLADGALDFQGRLDHQVKIRGFRIELGEIEASLAAHPEVQEAIVLAREDQPGNKWLVAYVTGNAKASGLSEYLRGRLPDYMVPSAFVVLETLPLTANGKVDRRALLATEGKNDPQREHVAPATEMERRLCEIWQEVLGMERVSVEDSFFDLGGHSLLVVKLVSRINGCFGIRLSPRHLFESSSVRRLAAVIEGFAAAAPGAWEPLVALSGEPGLPRLYCVPGAGMFSVAMAPLARALAGRMALHVLEARGLDGISPPQTSLDEIVESYGSAIKQRQPQGPYHLAGHSFGGCIAFELARWLEARGDRASIVLLDSFLDYFGSGEAEASPVPAAIEVEDEPANGQSELPGFREVFRSQLEMQRRYRPSGRVQAPITLLHAEDGLMAGDRLAGVLARYDRVAELPVRSFAVRGGHHSMLSGENAMHLAEKILELIGQPAVPEVSEVL